MKAYIYILFLLLGVVLLLNLLFIDINSNIIYLAFIGISTVMFLIHFSQIKANIQKDPKFYKIVGTIISISFIFLTFYTFYQYGSPLVYDKKVIDHSDNPNIIEINRPIKQSFKADSNNLGTIGIFLKSDKLASEEEETQISSYNEAEVLFSLYKKDTKNPIYRNTYYINRFTLQHGDYYPFGFPIQTSSMGKDYIFELKLLNELNWNFETATGKDGEIQHYQRYVFQKSDISNRPVQVLELLIKKFSVIVNETLIPTAAFFILLLSAYYLLRQHKLFFKQINKLLIVATFIFSLFCYFYNLLVTPLTQTQNIFFIFSTFLFTISITIVLLFNSYEDITNNIIEQVLTKKTAYIALILIVVMGFSARVYRLGYQNLREDEFQVVSAAKGFSETGEFYRWNWIEDRPACLMKTENCTYPRAWPHTYLISQFYNLIGVSEFSSRIISAIFGIFLVLISYPIALYLLKSKSVALLSTLVISFYPTYINLSRYTRMYAILIPLYLIISYTIYRALTERNTINFRNTKLNNFIKKYLDFNFLYGAVTLVLLYIAYNIHINSLVILPISFFFCLYLMITKKEIKYYVLISTCIIFFIIGLVAQIIFKLIPWAVYFSFFKQFNIAYIDYVFQYPFGTFIGMILFIMPLIMIFRQALAKLKDPFIFLYISVFFSLFFFVFIGDRYASFVYISHITPITLFIIMYGFTIMVSLFKKQIQLLMYGALLIVLSLHMYEAIPRLYTHNSGYGTYSKAYAVIMEHFNPEREVIFGHLARDYYLQGLPKGAKVIDMREYTLEEFRKDTAVYKEGWIVWENRKSGQINRELLQYIESSFQKVHGLGVDDTNVTVYKYKINK